MAVAVADGQHFLDLFHRGGHQHARRLMQGLIDRHHHLGVRQDAVEVDIDLIGAQRGAEFAQGLLETFFGYARRQDGLGDHVGYFQSKITKLA